MILGNFVFSIKSISPDSLARTSEYNWAERERVGDLPNLQNLGIKLDQIEIAGIFYERFNPSMNSVDSIRASNLVTNANNLITDSGEVIGKFVITQIKETQSFFEKNGKPKKIEFSMTIKRVSDSANGLALSNGAKPIAGTNTELSRSYLRW